MANLEKQILKVMRFSVMILKASLKAILQALRQKKRFHRRGRRRFGEDKTILYITFKVLHLLSNKLIHHKACNLSAIMRSLLKPLHQSAKITDGKNDHSSLSVVSHWKIDWQR